MKNICLLIVLIFSSIVFSNSSSATLYSYSSTVTLCTGTCDSFASLALGSSIGGVIDIDTTANGSFSDTDINFFDFAIQNPALPSIPPMGDPINDNPLLLSSASGIAASNGTSGTTDAMNDLFGGEILLEFLFPPFSSNGAFVIFDLITGNGQVCLFYATAGCIPGATQAVVFEGGFSQVLAPPPPMPPPTIPEPAMLGLIALGLFGIRVSRKKQ